MSASKAPGGFQAAARSGYMGNELIFAAIDLLATSAAEPALVGRRYASGQRSAAKAYEQYLMATGAPRALLPGLLSQKGLTETITNHPILETLNKPNPFASRFQLWSTLIMDRYLAGNAYIYAIGGKKRPQELWRLRPDRVRVVPDTKEFVKGYVYKVGRDEIELGADEVIHFKTRHPLDDYYGMPPLLPLMPRLNIDNYMRDFVRAFFENGGNPGAVLAVKSRLSQDAKDEIRARSRRQFSGAGGWFEWLILDQTEASFTPLTMSLGERGLAAPELSNITEARIAMTFGIPASILGPLVGLEKSSYANKRADWQVLWDVTLAPLYSDMDDTLNLAFAPLSGIDEIVFDLSQVKAMQEDVDKLHERARANVAAGLWTLEEGRLLTGVEPTAGSGQHYLMPTSVTLTGVDDLDAEPEEPAAIAPASEPPDELPEPEGTEQPKALMSPAHCPECNQWLAREARVGQTLWCRRCKGAVTLPAA